MQRSNIILLVNLESALPRERHTAATRRNISIRTTWALPVATVKRQGLGTTAELIPAPLSWKLLACLQLDACGRRWLRVSHHQGVALFPTAVDSGGTPRILCRGRASPFLVAHYGELGIIIIIHTDIIHITLESRSIVNGIIT